MQGTVLYGTGDIRFEEVPEPKITKPTDAIIRLAATCVCGSDLWSYRGISPVNQPTPMGHEYCGIIEEVGSAGQNREFVTAIAPQVRSAHACSRDPNNGICWLGDL